MGTMLESWSVAFLAAGGASEAQGGCARAGRAPGACRPPAEGKIQMFEHLDRGGTMPVNVHPADAKAQDYVGLVLPGGVANPRSAAYCPGGCRLR